MNCEFCSLALKSKYILKTHLTSNKACLKLRGLEMSTKFICDGCNMNLTSKMNLNVHIESCKKYSLLKVKEEYDLEIKKMKEAHELELKSVKEAHYNECFKLNLKCNNLEQNLSMMKIDHEGYIKLQVRYEELEKQHEKTISKLEMKISQCDDFIKLLAREGSNKVTTTTNNTVNNTVRNQLSTTFTLDNLEPKKLEDTMREHYTERDFFGGQKRLANFFLERVIKTPDDKMLICCTDTSRKKFKILDLRGNLKEDIEARSLCEKLKVPTQIVTKEIYEKVIVKIDKERDRLAADDRSMREKLLDDTMRAQKIYMDNFNFDDINYNQDFMHELCILLNV